MRCIISTSNNPAFNIAAEEFFFRNLTEDLLFLYINSPSVVLGKHQNALAEINHRYVFDNNIPVIRRLSGGGAVYHDLGNLNFSFHKTINDLSKANFKLFNQPIVDVLNGLGVPAQISDRNDIVVNGFKVSGHAEHVFRNRVLSHGTLLVNANKEALSAALKNQSGKFTGKAIQSVRSKVANVSDFLAAPITIDYLVDSISNNIVANNGGLIVKGFSKNEQEQIEQLASTKYETWQWNFGYSPKYAFQKECLFDNGDTLLVYIEVEKGSIVIVDIKGNKFSEEIRNAAMGNLINSAHEIGSIKKSLVQVFDNETNVDDIANCFF